MRSKRVLSSPSEYRSAKRFLSEKFERLSLSSDENDELDTGFMRRRLHPNPHPPLPLQQQHTTYTGCFGWGTQTSHLPTCQQHGHDCLQEFQPEETQHGWDEGGCWCNIGKRKCSFEAVQDPRLLLGRKKFARRVDYAIDNVIRKHNDSLLGQTMQLIPIPTAVESKAMSPHPLTDQALFDQPQEEDITNSEEESFGKELKFGQTGLHAGDLSHSDWFLECAEGEDAGSRQTEYGSDRSQSSSSITTCADERDDGDEELACESTPMVSVTQELPSENLSIPSYFTSSPVGYSWQNSPTWSPATPLSTTSHIHGHEQPENLFSYSERLQFSQPPSFSQFTGQTSNFRTVW